MLKDLADRYYFEGNYNCAESILRAANEYYGLGLHDRDMILMAGFGAGMQTGDTCGTLLSAIGVLSMKFVAAKAHESADIRPAATLLTRKFRQRFGDTLCKNIKAAHFRPEVRCQFTVHAACDLLEETLAEYCPAKQ